MVNLEKMFFILQQRSSLQLALLGQVRSFTTAAKQHRSIGLFGRNTLNIICGLLLISDATQKLASESVPKLVADEFRLRGSRRVHWVNELTLLLRWVRYGSPS